MKEENEAVWQQKNDRGKFRLFVIILVVVLALCLIGVFIWNIIPKDYDKVNIINADELSEKVGGGEINNFRRELLKVLKENKIINENDSIEDVVVREGTVISGTDLDGFGGYWKTTTFLVDIDSLKQTYSVRLIETDEELEGIKAQIYCPKQSESKYPESKCKGINSSDNSSIVYRLPYETKLASGEKIVVMNLESLKKQGEWKNILQIYLYSCNDKNPPVAETEELVRKWVEESDDELKKYYTYNIRAGYCEGDAI